MIINNQENSLFITIDGANGSGKSTLLKALSKRITELGFNLFVTKEPSENLIGKFIRKNQEVLNGKALACMVAADRYLHIEEDIYPNLTKGKIVISDRYIASSLVYQLIDGLSYDFIWRINSEILLPDLSIILNVSKEILTERLNERKHLTRFEHYDHKDKEVKLYKKAVTLMSKKGFNILEIDNQYCSIEENTNAIIDEIIKLTEKKYD